MNVLDMNVLKFIIFPVVTIEESLPFGGLLFFLILFAGVVRNPNVPYFIRYNAFQALLLDISLIIISYLLMILSIPLLGSFVSALSSIVFIFTLCIFIYSIFKCIYGVEPEIPLISKSVRMQI